MILCSATRGSLGGVLMQMEKQGERALFLCFLPVSVLFDAD